MDFLRVAGVADNPLAPETSAAASMLLMTAPEEGSVTLTDPDDEVEATVIVGIGRE